MEGGGGGSTVTDDAVPDPEVDESPDRPTFGRLVQRMREIRGISQRTLAARVTARGVSLSFAYLSQLESGEKQSPSLGVAVALAQELKVDAHYFTGDAEAVQAVEATVVLEMAIEDAGIVDLALRASRLTPDGRRALAAALAGLEAGRMTRSTRAPRRPKEGRRTSLTPEETE
jgi:transcriptional regulator with XRE-family HTH domain